MNKTALHPQNSPGSLSRRQFLKWLGVSGASLGLLGVSSCSVTKETTPTKAPPIEVTRIVETTRIVEITVEATRIVENTPEPTPIQEEPSMIWYVDIEHEDALADPQRAPDFEKVRNQRAWVMEDISGMTCEPIFYRQVSSKLATQKNVNAIAISGNTTDWEYYDFTTFAPLFEIIKSGCLPVIGLCGGHQLIGLAYDAECGPLRKLKPGEPEVGDFATGWFKEVGFLPVNVIQSDPIFASLGKQPIFFESHYWEIKQVPDEFELLASTDECKVQSIRHKQLPIYGTQFHPEVNSADKRDGRTLLANFFRIAGIKKD
jgi:GMP synthase-like glutamine amidotransferase